jgi:hypothetical protein
LDLIGDAAVIFRAVHQLRPERPPKRKRPADGEPFSSLDEAFD